MALKVALAQAIAERLQGRSGIRHDTAPAKEKFPEVAGKTRDIAAAKAGLGSEAQRATRPAAHVRATGR